MKKILLSLIFVASSCFAGSGNEVGNGGNVLICNADKAEETVVLFDFFEYQNQHSEAIEERTGNKEEIGKALIEQVKKYDLKLSNILNNRFSQFMDNAQLVSTGALKTIKDSNHLIVSPGKDCKVTQVAILKKKVLANEKKFLINEILWNKLSETHKAGLMFHELIYEYFSDLGEGDSVNARALNAFIFSKGFPNSNNADYWKFIQSMKVPHYK